MKPKPKKCKGINKAKAHPGCGELHLKRRFGLCPYCLLDWMDNFEEGREWREKQFLPKVRASMQKTRRKKDKETREKLKTITQLINEARKPFQRWIRKRDEKQPCISCGNLNSPVWDAGHYLKAEVFTGLIFDEMNVNKQCRKCNTYLGGNEVEYRKGMVKKYGLEAVRYLEESANKLRRHRYSREELKSIKKEYLKRLRDERTL